MDRSDEMSIYVEVVNKGGFSAAAPGLRLTPSAVSKKIARLEDRLGVRLLNRTTRQLSVTEEGEAYFQRCKRILADIDEAEAEVASVGVEPRGILRVNSAIHFGLHHLVPLLPAFFELYPKVEVELTLDDRMADIVEEGIDVAIRAGFLEDSSLVARRLGGNDRVVVASPAYLERHGEPSEPEALESHNCLRYNQVEMLNHWEFVMPDGARKVIHVTGNFSVSTGEAIREAAIAGIGIARLATFSVGSAIGDGILRHILQDHTQDGGNVFAVYPHRRHLSSKVRVFVDFLADRIGPAAPWDAQPDAQPDA